MGKAFETWVWATWAYEMGLAIVFGILVGLTCRVALKYSETHNWIDKKNFLSFEIALAVRLHFYYTSTPLTRTVGLCHGILYNLSHLLLHCRLLYRGGIRLGRVVRYRNRRSPCPRSH